LSEENKITGKINDAKLLHTLHCSLTLFKLYLGVGEYETPWYQMTGYLIADSHKGFFFKSMQGLTEDNKSIYSSTQLLS